MLVDLIVNDTYEIQVGQDKHNRGLLIAAYERFIHTARKLSPQTSLVFVNTCTLSSCSETETVIKIVAEQHNVPVVSMGQLAFIVSLTNNEVD